MGDADVAENVMPGVPDTGVTGAGVTTTVGTVAPAVDGAVWTGQLVNGEVQVFAQNGPVRLPVGWQYLQEPKRARHGEQAPAAAP